MSDGAYPAVTVRDRGVVGATVDAHAVGVTLDDGSTEQARRVIVATGTDDRLPARSAY
jgi:thioredoxin reductase